MVTGAVDAYVKRDTALAAGIIARDDTVDALFDKVKSALVAMLYRGKKVAVIGLNDEAEAEADALREMGVEVMYFDKAFAKNYKILGEQRVTAIEAEGREFPVDGVFILRSTIAPSSFLTDIELDGPHIRVDRSMKTSIPGVFAAGDCTGKPYQIAKAVGEGNVAALSACEYLDKK